MRVSAATAVLAVVAVAAAIVASRIFMAAHRPLSWAAAATVAAVLLDPIVDVLERRIPRLAAVLVTLIVVIAAGYAIAYVAFDDLDDGLQRLARTAEDAAARLEERDDNVGDLARDIEASRRVEVFADAVEERVTGGEDVLAGAAGTAPTYLLGGILTIFLMSYGPGIARAAVNQVPDDRRRRTISENVLNALGRSRRAVLLTLALGLVVGLAVTLLASLLDVPAAAALGLSAGVFALFPHVGIVVGSIPLLLLLLGLRSGTAAVTVAAGVVVAQAADSLELRPRIAARSLNIGLLMPWIVALVGYAVYGVGGAAYGLAFAVFGLALVDEVHRRDVVPDGPAAAGAIRDGANRHDAADDVPTPATSTPGASTPDEAEVDPT